MRVFIFFIVLACFVVALHCCHLVTYLWWRSFSLFYYLHSVCRFSPVLLCLLSFSLQSNPFDTYSIYTLYCPALLRT